MMEHIDFVKMVKKNIKIHKKILSVQVVIHNLFFLNCKSDSPTKVDSRGVLIQQIY